MTSVLYSAGLNYQQGNPLRTEIRGLRASVTGLETLAQEQAKEIAALKAQAATLEKAVRDASAAATAAASAAAASAATAAAAAQPKPPSS